MKCVCVIKKWKFFLNEVLGDFDILTVLQLKQPTQSWVKGNFKITRSLLSDSWICDCNELSTEFKFILSSRDPQFHQMPTWLWTHTRTHTYAQHTNWSCITHAQTVCGSLQTRTTAWVVCWILLRLVSITAGHMNDSAVSSVSVCVCTERWMSSHAVCLKCVCSTSYQEPPWKCSCRAVSLSFCHGGFRHAPWPRRPRHLPHETRGDGWKRRGERGRKKKGHLLEEIKPTREEEWETDDVKWCKGEKKHGDGEGKRWVVGDVRDNRNKIYGIGRGEMWRRQIFGSVFAFWFDVMYLNGHSEPMYNNRTCNIDFFLLEIYVNYQSGSRHIISQLTGPVNAGRVKNVVITYATRAPDLELAKHRQQTAAFTNSNTHRNR